MDETGTTQRIAEWIATVPRPRIARAAPLAIEGIRDAIGVILAGAAEPVPRKVLAAVTRWGSGPARVIGHGQGLPAPWAALVNGAAAHVLDYDDTFAPLNGHATAVLVPAILALGEERASTGPDLLDALVVGLEVMACVGRGVNPKHYALGWHATSTIGAIGAAGACARLLKLSASEARDSLSLGVSMAAGTRMQLGAEAKSMHAGFAAKAGILAATLAEAGAGGAVEALDGRWRFAELYAGRPAPEGAMLPPSENEALAIESIGISYKAYPTCAATHLSLDALLALRDREGIDPSRITAIETDLPLVLSRNLMHPRPTTGMEARFSMEYCLAAAAAQGRLTLADFEGDAIHRDTIRALMPRITMRGVPEREDAPSPPTRVAVRLDDGTVLTETRTDRLGSRGNPMSEADHDAKFRDCAGRVMDAAGVARALAAINGLATGGDAASLVDALIP
ncbi:MmgE/PrpD family protein [Roseomonas stagni]|uniref:MmgE/PrpD family protein n=1 Tax=Falsiroseomonas algicola TaxID=2716930 RepID=A0A6M1LP97_9PROT|nr:MmgE/PrpD family protein [Falsiroseomonas algicola]NGM22186.1 MmgE/PrpD family protein [Falsiroseomonas algicola]